ncbi:glycosyltransferase family 2 protein [Chryseobacterium sp. GP-SGM7]|uniref:glycosyltransferase family 2 protein n=1 Tax=Chryseobacterium sp. GP-SGM7 TaxID=3411323 RepID=UPI003B93FFC3
MNKPLVSIVVISYNQEKYIKENLDSLKAQTYPNWELIVADDASPDNSVEEFKNWLKENNVNAKELFHTKNTGLATVLNEALDLCEGKYVKFIAADDYLHPECLEESVKSLEEKSDEFGMVFTDFHPVNDGGESVDFNINYENKNYFNEDYSLKDSQLVKYNCIIAPTTLVKKEAILSTGKYDPSLLLEDHHRWLMINEKYKILFINKKLAYYRVLPTGITGKRHNRMIEEDMYLRIKYDKSGINKKQIYDYIYSRYLQNIKIQDFIIHEYLEYPHRAKHLSFFLKNKIPPYLFHIITKIYKR